jgi:predicted HTH transcriptional regulator
MTSPIDPKRLAELIAADETDLFECKQEWWDLDSRLGKGELARGVLAMANTLSPGLSGYIVFGVKDKKAGGGVLGVPQHPSQEKVVQILNTYTNPVPRIRLDAVQVEGKTVSVLEVMWSEFHPHYATRDVDTVLSTDVVYFRKASTVGRLKPVEHERLLRAKEARVPVSMPRWTSFRYTIRTRCIGVA